MPARKPRSKRYNSEYHSHYKTFPSRRPHTVKGELTRSVIPSDLRSSSSTPRAGLQSTQLGVIHEPPIQRKRIVAYEKNHNIFSTGTVKELADSEWLVVDNSSRVDPNSSRQIQHFPTKTHKKESNIQNRESPILAAQKKLLNNTKQVTGYPYVPDGVKRKSTYTQDFGVNGHKSKAAERPRKSPTNKPKPVVGRNKSGISPDRLPPAGIRTMTSMGDKRLVQPSDNSQYMRSPEREKAMKVYDSEYSRRFKSIDSPEYQGSPSHVHPSQSELNWYKEAITRRNEAYGYAKHARGTHFSRDELDKQNRRNAQYQEDHDESCSTASRHSPTKPPKKGKKVSKNGMEKKEPIIDAERQPPRKEAWIKRPASPVASDHSFSTSYTETTATTADEQFFLERGRSPTPELREAGQARRHHYDMTTNILNEKMRKSLTFSDEKQRYPSDKNGYHKHERPSDSLRSLDGSYIASKHKSRDDDVMSEISMASQASSAAETLERARVRRDHFWHKENNKRLVVS